jgi:glycine betaine/choline ABC-type transport system substrate-binding protein
MQQLNAQVDDEGLPPGQVAQTWLQEEGFVG